MMTKEQSNTVTLVFNKFFNDENDESWSEIDHYLSLLDFIDDDQLYREADVLYSIHTRGEPMCEVDHPREECFIPLIIEAVGAILELYRETGNLHKNNKYILEYYLALTQAQIILVDSKR